MKKFLCIILSILLIASTMLISTCAANVEIDGIIYEFDNDMQAYSIVGTNITEPYTYVYLKDVIDGYKVAKIEDNALSATGLSIENVPSYLTEIGEGAFRGCSFSNLTCFDAENVKISSYAFEDCSFYNCLDFCGNGIDIDSYAFNRVSFSYDVYFNGTDIYIAPNAFNECYFSSPVYFRWRNTTIDSYAFQYSCFSKSLSLGNPWDDYPGIRNNIKIKEYAFANASFSWDEENSVIVCGDMIDSEPNAFSDALIEDLTIYHNMDFLKDSGIYSLTTLRLKGVCEIPDGAFGRSDIYTFYAFYLENIYIDGALCRIGNNTFSEIPGELNVYINDLANWCYDVEFNDNPLTYGGKLYLDNKLLTELVLPEGGDTVSARAFEDYMYLESLTVPSYIRKISYRSFLNNNNLTDITIAEGLETIEEEGLMFFSDREISLPKSLENIEFIGYWEILEMLYCYPDSAAQRYAEANNVPYTLYSMDIKSENTIIDNENMCIMTSDKGAQNIEDIINISGYTVAATPSLSVNGVEMYGTGSVVNIYNNNGELESTYTVVVTGDLDGDAVCDALDVAKAERVANDHESAELAQVYAANGCVSEKIDASSYQNVVNVALNG